MSIQYKYMAAIAIAIFLIGLFTGSILINASSSDSVAIQESPEPLYWVAPMDPNYRSDKPGKSAMGMDLIPVYASGAEGGPGTISISPEVINNLGVRTVKADFIALQSVIETVGYIGYDEDNLIHIHPRVEGWVEKLYVTTDGDSVQEGQPLYELYSPELVAAQEELLLAVDRNNAVLVEGAEQRLRALQVPQQTIEAIRASGEAEQNVLFYAPTDGVVDNLNVREGFYVTPGIALMSVGNLDQVWVEAEVFERQVNLLEVGLPVTMDLDYLPGRSWVGEVDYLYPTLNPVTRTARVRLRFENIDKQLKPNMFAQVHIATHESPVALSIPREALIRTGTQDRVVLALGEGRFKSVSVSVGAMDRNRVEILSGLAVGDEVVTSAQFLLDSESSKTSDFMRMNYEEDNPAAEIEEAISVWTGATIQRLFSDDRRTEIAHEPIAEWNWPAMIMSFSLSEELDLSPLYDGLFLHVEVTELPQGGYQILNYHIPEQQTDPTPPVSEMPVMDHSQMQNGE